MDAINPELLRLAATGALLLTAILPFVFAACILQMIDAAAKQRQRPLKIYLVDFFSLTFLVQIPFAIVFQIDDRPHQSAMLACGFWAATMVLIWWITIRTISRAGISKVSTRAWISLLVIPMTYVGSFSISFIGIHIIESKSANQGYESLVVLIIVEAVLIALMIAAFFVAKRAIDEGASPC